MLKHPIIAEWRATRTLVSISLRINDRSKAIAKGGVAIPDWPFICSEEDRAWHEAGHAVVGMLAGCRIELVTIVYRDEKYAARTVVEWDDDTRRDSDKLRFYICYLFAGAAVERIFKSEEGEIDVAEYDHLDIREELGCQHDSVDWNEVKIRIPRLLELRGENPSQEACEKLSEDIWRETVGLVREKWTVVDAIATALIREKELTGQEIRKIWSSVAPLPESLK